ncbi:MAG: V-type ATP synthase subunit K [Trueperaceae bacterium]|nr:V-type ATP synthase subunit K [Trueperaceae bacterium]
MKQVQRVFGLTTLLALTAGLAFAQNGLTIGDGMVAIGAALAIGISAIAVAIAMAAIGSAGAGVLAERPQAFGQILIYLVIPETLIIFGFVIAFFLNGQIG